MADFNFPDICPNNSTWGIRTNTGQFQSPFTGAVQTSGSRFSLWVCTLDFSFKEEDERADLQGFLLAINGQENRVLLRDHAYRKRGVGVDVGAQVNGAGQTGSSLNIDNATDAVNWLRRGDMFLVNGELKMVTQDVTVAGGAATIAFNPPLRTPPPDNAALTINAPFSTRFILQGQEHMWSNDPGPRTPFSGFQLSFLEDVL